MRELSHPLMGLLCRADDHPRQPPPHAACCCFARRDRLGAGVRCSWRSRLGVVSCLTRPSSGVQWPVPPPSEEGVEVQPRNASEVGKVWRRPAFALPQTPAFSPSLLTGSSSHMFISTPRGTACAVSVRAKMKIEGSGRSARRFRALDDINII